MRLRNILVLLIILLAIGGVYYFSNAPEPIEEPDPQTFVWLIDMEEIEHITLSLPREGLSESFIKISKGDAFPWYFDDPERSDVDSNRWGGGIPLLLSGPGADRIIAEDASTEKLAEFGLDEPSMQITLTLESGRMINIDAGDYTPNTLTYYVRAPNSNDVALVDYTWYEVLEGIVRNPPYAPPPEEE
ncbi:DUF4340 domain-containing protein [Chloroflexota bacterium]